jgi:hypothetical protein
MQSAQSQRVAAPHSFTSIVYRPSSFLPQSHQVLLILSGAASCQQVQRCCYAKWLTTKSGCAAFFYFRRPFRHKATKYY